MAITYKFSGHESFPCKSLWLKKGYDFVANKNDKKTKLGDYLFDESKGKDKYLEDIATLWLLHFNLVFSEDSTGFEDFK